MSTTPPEKHPLLYPLTKEHWTQLKQAGQTRLDLGGTATEYLDGRRQRLDELLTELARDVDSVENVTVDKEVFCI